MEDERLGRRFQKLFKGETTIISTRLEVMYVEIVIRFWILDRATGICLQGGFKLQEKELGKGQSTGFVQTSWKKGVL